MPINITAAGAAGIHSFRKVNVNTEDNFVFFTGDGADVIPPAIANNASYIFSNGVGSISGITNGGLVYANIVSPQVLEFKNAADAVIDLTDSTAGGVALNVPTLFANTLEIGMSTPTNQAVKYFTNQTPLTGLTSGSTYFLKNVPATFSGVTPLYTFTSHSFTTAGQTGRVGPTSAQILAGYSTPWHGQFLRRGDFDGYQDWTVPVSGEYTFNLSGAAGFDGTGAGTAGRGATVRGTIALTKGEVITIAVGQRGNNAASGGIWGGSGGGSFVVRKSSNQPLFVAGGGAGAAATLTGRDAVLTTLGGDSSQNQRSGTTPGIGGLASGGFSAGGGGFASRGFDGVNGQRGGGSFGDGLSMPLNSRTGGYGGFGGGGQADGQSAGQSAGGGGFSGGAGVRRTNANSSGGGGGSFITPTATAVATSTGVFDGATTFNAAAITNLNSFNTGEGSVTVTLVASFTSGNELYPTALDAENGTNKLPIAPQGSSFHSLVPISVDLATNRIFRPTAHTFTNNTAITFNFENTPPGGISESTIYYVTFVDTFTYSLSSSPTSVVPVDITIPSARALVGTDTVSRVVVNTATGTLTIPNHGFLVNQPIQYNVGDGTAISPLQNNVTYYVSEVLDANRIRLKTALNSPASIVLTSAGTGNTHSFIFITVNLLEDTLYIANHGLVSGQAVRYQRNSETIIGGLVDGTTYYIIKVDDSIVRLSVNQSLTPVVNLTTVGTGTQQLTITSLNFVNDTITVPGHGFLQGELIQYDSRGQQVVGGLTTATPYYVIFVDGDNIRLATTPENAVTGTAVNLVESPAGVGVHSLQSLSKTPDGIYEITSVPSPSTFTVEAKGNVPQLQKTFNPRSSVDLNLDAFFLPSHGFVTGTRVTYTQGAAGTPISGLTNATDYFVVSLNRDYVRLSASAADSQSGITLTVDDYGTGINHVFTSAQINGNISGGGNVTVASGSVLVNGNGTSFAKILKVGDRFRLFPPNVTTVLTFQPANINTTNFRITSANNFVTGDTVVFNNNGGVSPSPIVNGFYYFVRRVSATEVTLHGSASDAAANTNLINFSTQGTGSNFTLTRTVPVSPIIRKITAVGSDTQITVDRPYANSYSAVGYSFPTFIYVRPQGYSLHRPFDGGVEMSAGAGTSLAQIVRQTRKYFRYQSGKGIQTSCGINFKPSVDVESMNRFSDTTIEVKTRRPHGLVSGLFIIMSQATNSNGLESSVYNGRFQVTVVDLTTFRVSPGVPITEDIAYGFPQFYVESWSNGAVRSGMFDFQNGAFFEFDGQSINAVRRSSTQQLAGTAACLQGSELVFGTNTKFTAQLEVGDFVVMRGQSYRVVEIASDTRMSVRPEYKGSSGTEKEFNPGNGTTGVVKLGADSFSIVSHGFADRLPVVYNSIDGESIGGLINGRTYYIALIDNNSFRLTASPTSSITVNLSTVGTTAVHSFTPAKSGIIITKTVDTRVPQSEWSLDVCDGTGVTGYDLDLSRIQMAYIDYSWYGAGKIRFGFKTGDGQVQYVHEFVHNNVLYESYFRSGNLPARYEVVTYDDPTYIPFLFHWGTSVMMDGGFDDDNAYLFTSTSQTLDVTGTTSKAFGSTGIDLATDLFAVKTHGFRTGNVVQFQSIAANGFPGNNDLNPATQVIGSQTLTTLTNTTKYKVFVNSPNLIHLTPFTATITSGATFSRAGTTVTVVTAAAHNIPASNYVGVYGISNAGVAITNLPTQHVGPVTVTNATTFTFQVTGSFTVTSTPVPSAVLSEVVNFTTQGNTQYTYFLYPDGALNNTSGPNYQPLLSIRLSPSVSSGLTGALGDRDILNRMQLRLQEIGISTTQLVDVKVLLNPRLNNLNFQGVDSPSLTQTVEHTSADTVSGGVQVYNFRASGGSGGAELSTSVDVSTLFELSNSILGGDAIFPDGPDILTIAVSRLTGTETLTSAKMSWTEAQA